MAAQRSTSETYYSQVHVCACVRADTIGDVKREIKVVAGVPVGEQALWAGVRGDPVDDAATLDESGIRSDRTLFFYTNRWVMYGAHVRSPVDAQVLPFVRVLACVECAPTTER